MCVPDGDLDRNEATCIDAGLPAATVRCLDELDDARPCCGYKPDDTDGRARVNSSEQRGGPISLGGRRSCAVVPADVRMCSRATSRRGRTCPDAIASHWWRRSEATH